MEEICGGVLRVVIGDQLAREHVGAAEVAASWAD